jgi:biopolymer transport protein ExbD
MRRRELTHDRRQATGRKRLRRSRSGSIHLNIIPLVDVTFLLMIFFVIGGTFEIWEGVLSSRILPSDPSLSIPLPMSPVTVRISATGANSDEFIMAVDGLNKQTGLFEELTALLIELQQNPAFSPEVPLVILSDGSVRWDHVVNAWNSAVRAGYRNVAFGST